MTGDDIRMLDSGLFASTTLEYDIIDETIVLFKDECDEKKLEKLYKAIGRIKVPDESLVIKK